MKNMVEKVKRVEQQTTKYQTGKTGGRAAEAAEGQTGRDPCPSDAERQEVNPGETENGPGTLR